jgi:hypothetical protein
MEQGLQQRIEQWAWHVQMQHLKMKHFVECAKHFQIFQCRLGSNEAMMEQGCSDTLNSGRRASKCGTQAEKLSTLLNARSISKFSVSAWER